MRWFGRPHTTTGTRPVITLGGQIVPHELEPLHFAIVGATGVGKTVMTEEALSTIVSRGDRAIVFDPGGHYLSRFFREGDTVLNPFDARSPGWSIFSEVRKDFDYDRLARCVVPPGRGSDAAWHHYAQVLLATVMRSLLLRGDASTTALIDWATCRHKSELATVLAGTPAQGLTDEDASKALASTRFILTTHLQPHSYVRPGDFSLRDWLHKGTGNLFITSREDMAVALRPLMSCWIDIVANATLSLAPDKDRRLWFVLDELGALGQLGSLESLLLRGRKFGACVMAGFQSLAQLDATYGREHATVLRSCFRSLIIFGLAKADPDTADTMSRALGEHEFDREQRNVSEGPHGISRGSTLQRITERLAKPRELCEQPNLTAQLALAGDRPSVAIRVSPRDLSIVAAPFEDISC